MNDPVENGATGSFPANPATIEEASAASPTAGIAAPHNFFDRIKHHKVVHWLLAYAATAYTLLHGVEMLSEAQEWPHAIVRVVSWLLVLGAPIVVTLAWYHGAKALHRVSGPELLIIAFLGLIAGTLLWAFTGRGEAAGETQAAAKSAILDKSIAVLPFTNLSSSADDEYLADGLADTLLTMLSQNRQLKVIARTSSFSFKGKNDDVRSIGEKLGVAALLEGSVQRSSDHLRVIAQLISTKDGTHLWSKTYDRMMTDVFAVQDEIAAQVAASLSASLTTSAEGANNTKPKHVPPVEAYQEYLQGVKLLDDRVSPNYESATEHFQKAIDIDPVYALAFVGLAQAALRVAPDSVLLPPNVWIRANRALQRALVLEPNLAEAWTQLGVARYLQGDALGANQAFRRAIEVNPGYASAYATFGVLGAPVGLGDDEALELLERAAALDPLQASVQASRAEFAWITGKFDDALRFARRALDLDANQTNAYLVIGQVHSSRGQLDEAVRYRRKALSLQPGLPNALIALDHLYLYLGDDASAAAARNQLAEAAPNSIQNVYRLAEQAWFKGDGETAVREASHAFQVVPGFRNASRLLARIDIDAGRYDAAIQRIRGTYPELNTVPVSINIINGFASLLLSEALLAAGRADEARQVLEAAEHYFRTSKRPTSLQFVEPGVTLTLARTLALQGKRQEALKALRDGVDHGDGYDWQYWSKDPMFSSIADAPEFKQCVDIVKARNARQLESLRRNPNI